MILKKKKKAGRKRGESLFYRRIRANKYRINSRIRKPPSIHCDSGKNYQWMLKLL